MSTRNELIKLVNKLPIQKVNVAIPPIFSDLIQKSQKAWNTVSHNQISLMGCNNSGGGNGDKLAIVQQDQSYISLDDALADLMEGKRHNQHRTIFQLCEIRDFLQKGGNRDNAFPLIMFYFPLVVEKINESKCGIILSRDGGEEGAAWG